MSSIAVIGAGAWGTALALQAARAGHDVTLWARDPSPLHHRRESPRLPGHRLPVSVTPAGELPGDGHAALLLAVPSGHLRQILQQLQPQAPILLCAKGLSGEPPLLPSEVLDLIHPGHPWAVLSGPNFAHELAAGLPAASVLATPDPDLRATLTALLATPSFRIYGNDDPLGVQLGGAAKNVIAIAAGAVMGAGLGENARAALVTRGLAELARLVVALGGKQDTAFGLSGLGDLLLTCTGPASRNYSLGLALGQGTQLATALAQRTTATEGVTTAPALVKRANTLDLPICRAVAALLTHQASLADCIATVLARPRRDE
jgi:glycerol-3-phosphate dehydrogenase (NAD(P)+)